LITQYLAQVRVDPQCLGNVSLGREGAHKDLIPGLSKGDQINELASRSDSRRQFGSSSPESGRCVGLEGANSNLLHLSAPFVNPWGVLPRQQFAFRGEESGKGRTPRPSKFTERNLGLGPVHGLDSDLDIDGSRLAEPQAQARATVEHSRAKDLAELGDESIQSDFRGGGEVTRPQDVDELVPAGQAVAVEDEVGEQQATLTSR